MGSGQLCMYCTSITHGKRQFRVGDLTAIFSVFQLFSKAHFDGRIRVVFLLLVVTCIDEGKCTCRKFCLTEMCRFESTDYLHQMLLFFIEIGFLPSNFTESELKKVKLPTFSGCPIGVS